MVERLLCKQEVIGSIPFTSTKGLVFGIERSGKAVDRPGFAPAVWIFGSVVV